MLVVEKDQTDKDDMNDKPDETNEYDYANETAVVFNAVKYDIDENVDENAAHEV